MSTVCTFGIGFGLDFLSSKVRVSTGSECEALFVCEDGSISKWRVESVSAERPMRSLYSVYRHQLYIVCIEPNYDFVLTAGIKGAIVVCRHTK